MKETVLIYGVADNNEVKEIRTAVQGWFSMHFLGAGQRLKATKRGAEEGRVMLVCLREVKSVYLYALGEFLEENDDIAVVVLSTPDELSSFKRTVNCEIYKHIGRPAQMHMIESALRRCFIDMERKLNAYGTTSLSEKSSSPLSKNSATDKRKTILVVDDDPRILRLVCMYLKDLYNVSTALSGTVALKYLDGRLPDLMLLDNMMPVMSGMKLLEMVRKNPLTAELPVIFMTGIHEKDTVIKCIALKPRGYLVKPLEKMELVSRIKEVLGE